MDDFVIVIPEEEEFVVVRGHFCTTDRAVFVSYNATHRAVVADIAIATGMPEAPGEGGGSSPKPLNGGGGSSSSGPLHSGTASESSRSKTFLL